MGWIRNRVRPVHGSAIVSAILLVVLIVAYLRHGALPPVDRDLTESLQSLRNPAVTAAFVWLTALGGGPALTAVALAASGLLAASGRARLLFPMWFTFLGAVATTWTLKFLLDRDRPDLIAAVEVWSPSFPSAHASGVAALYGFIAWAILQASPSAGLRRTTLAVAGILVVLVGFSRLLLAVHFPSDVLAGWLVATLWLSLGMSLVRRRPAA